MLCQYYRMFSLVYFVFVFNMVTYICKSFHNMNSTENFLLSSFQYWSSSWLYSIYLCFNIEITKKNLSFGWRLYALQCIYTEIKLYIKVILQNPSHRFFFKFCLFLFVLLSMYAKCFMICYKCPVHIVYKQFTNFILSKVLKKIMINILSYDCGVMQCKKAS